jgi:type I restriction enzyme R subunit/putative DNA methylase
VDRIVDQEGERIVTERTVRADEPHFQGHYPGAPLMPGVLICEACFQTGALLLASSAGAPPAPTAGASPAVIQRRTRGYLPHWERAGATYFVTFRLADSIPEEGRKKIEFERWNIVKTAEAVGRPLSDDERARLELLYSERTDELLNAGHGECYLNEQRCAQIVADTLTKWDGERYTLYAWCVMPNHVHAVFKPLDDDALADTLHSWKSFTAKACNRLLGREGMFWQRESFDRLIRDEAEFEKRVRYTLENPVVAGLKNWKWVGGAAVGGAPTAQAGEAPALHTAALRPVLTRILEAKFRGMVRPGDLMRIEVCRDEIMGDAHVMSGRGDVAGKNVLRGKFMVAMVEVS